MSLNSFVTHVLDSYTPLRRPFGLPGLRTAGPAGR